LRPRCWRTATTGEIASLAGAADDPRYFQISLPVQPGNSGGALVDARGNVVGIVAAKLDASAALAATGSLPENVNFAGRAACS
jgi:S1-C subfamily serine protease